MCESIEMMLLSVLSPILRCEWHLDESISLLSSLPPSLSLFLKHLHIGILATVTTVVFLGMMVGSVVWGSASDRYGRRYLSHP